MIIKSKEKYVHVPLNSEYYKKLEEISKYEHRYICRQAEYFIRKAIDKYNKQN